MRLKSYFASSVEAALDQARRELGPDALLVNARPATPDARHLGAYEVVFGLQEKEPPRVASDHLRVEDEIADLRRQIERLAATSPRAPRLPTFDTGIEETLRVDPTLGPIVALVGPAGVGKTTMLLKLAIRCGLAANRRPWIVTTDVQRIAAADQLRALAALVGIGCDVADTPAALSQILEERSGKALILIDTPGLGPANFGDGEDLAHHIAAKGEIETHLVLSAATALDVLGRQASLFQTFAPSKLILTHMDETVSHVALASLAARAKLAVSYLGTGQAVPDDLEIATRERFLPGAGTSIPARKGAAA